MRRLLGLVTVLAATACMGQQPPPPKPPAEGARDLFFFGTAPKDQLPPIAHPAAPPNAGKAAPPAAKGATAPASAQPGRAANPAAALGALHLGLRYTLLLVTSPGDRGQPADPARNFRKGDCVAVDLEANRSGYLYVLAKQSSGDWIPLFPTPELADQSNRIDPGQVIRTPKQTCFEIDDPPGTETLFVVLSRNPRDIGELADSIKGPGDTPRQSPGPTQIAAAGKVNSAVEQIAQEFGTRDLPFTEVAKPAAPPAPVQKAAAKQVDKKEPEHAVYVVNGSSKPAFTLVTKVEIHHL
jgi:hypothetical protein